jgi:hypothetical protein
MISQNTRLIFLCLGPFVFLYSSQMSVYLPVDLYDAWSDQMLQI